MAKAVIGAVEIGGGVALLIWGGPAMAPFAWGLIMGGAGEELAFVAQVLQGNPAITASSKLASAPRDFVYGMTRKPGTFLYQSTTGHQLNEVVAWAAHSCYGIVGVYVDERLFYYNDSAEDPYGGGNGDGITYTDDNGNQYEFSVNCAMFHTLGRLWKTGAWSAGMTSARSSSSDVAGTYDTTLIGVPVSGVTYIFAATCPGTAGGTIPAFGSHISPGDTVTDGSIIWVCCGPAPGGYWFKELNAQDTSQWLSSAQMVGICGTYCKFVYDASEYNGPPQLKATIMGKNTIYDPRTSTYGYTSNAALCIADMIVDPDFGFGAAPVGSPQYTALWNSVYEGQFGDQLIAAANICDELVQLADASTSGTAQAWTAWTLYGIGDQFTAQGSTWTVAVAYESGAYFGASDYANIVNTPNPDPGYELRYACNGYGNSNQLPGEILSSMLMSCEGRITRQGGGYMIYPAAFYGTSLEFGENDLVAAPHWQASRKLRDRVNCVRATFVCPQYPYNVSGYTYDNKDPNIFTGEWQTTDAPPYAQDYLHGYGLITDPYQGDANLAQDGGVRLYMDRRYQFVISAAQTQRLMKIYLLRNRFQGNGTFAMKLSALQAQCQDVINFTFPALGMDQTYLEVTKFDWVLKESESDSGGEGARAIEVSTQLELQLTDPSVYDWSPAEEMTLYDQPSPDLENAFQVTPPSSLTVTSDLATSLTQPDGTVIPRIELQWVEPDDPFVTSGGTIQIQITPHGAGDWQTVLVVGGTTELAYLANVIMAQSYDMRIRSVRASGAYSIWVEADNIVVGYAYSATNLSPVAPDGTLIALALAGGTAQITVLNFTPNLPGGVPCTPSPSLLTGLAQSTVYFVYYVDPSFSGGSITPIATENESDFVGQPGYFLIGTIATPAYATQYRPSTYSDTGANATSNPTAAYDGNVSSAAYVSGNWWDTAAPGPIFTDHTANGQCTWSGFPNTSPASVTLYVAAAFTTSGSGGTTYAGSIIVNVGGTPTTIAALTAATGETVYPFTVPISTNLDTITVEANATSSPPSGSPTAGAGNAQMLIYEIWIQ